MTLPEILAKLERRLIVRALKKADGNIHRAAEDILGIARTTLTEKMKRHGLRKMGKANVRKWLSNKNIRSALWLADHQELFTMPVYDIGQEMRKVGLYSPTVSSNDMNYNIKEYIACIRDYYEWKKTNENV